MDSRLYGAHGATLFNNWWNARFAQIHLESEFITPVCRWKGARAITRTACIPAGLPARRTILVQAGLEYKLDPRRNRHCA